MDFNTKMLLTFSLFAFLSGMIVRGGATLDQKTPIADIIFGVSLVGFTASALCKVWL